ncbi:hypothetical protein WA026_011524 [Henosepilachna vigintioctopunctata]|uniref:Uncharacterized protein n=1 Tax=Henosepilachna vigintioctopunctata TaxID=420089 RepID=A0AAW1TTX1_9CUCU
MQFNAKFPSNFTSSTLRKVEHQAKYLPSPQKPIRWSRRFPCEIMQAARSQSIRPWIIQCIIAILQIGRSDELICVPLNRNKFVGFGESPRKGRLRIRPASGPKLCMKCVGGSIAPSRARRVSRNSDEPFEKVKLEPLIGVNLKVRSYVIVEAEED